MLFVSIFLVIVGLLSLVQGYRTLSEARASLSWPVVEGVVVDANFASKQTTSGSGKSRSVIVVYVLNLTYQYHVAGTVYTGTRIGLSEKHIGTQAEARALIAERYPKGAKVTVHYRHDKPEVCLLEPAIPEGTKAQPIVGLILIAAGILLYIYGR